MEREAALKLVVEIRNVTLIGLKAENILAVLNRARVPADMDLPGFRLHQLKGDRKGFWSVTVRANWRVTFRFENGRAYDVDLTDYH